MENKEKQLVLRSMLTAPDARLRLNAALAFGGWAFVAGSAAAVLCAVLARTLENAVLEAAVLYCLLVPAPLFLAKLLLMKKSPMRAARAVDRACRLDDRLASALGVEQDSYMAALLVNDAVRAAEREDLGRAVGVTLPEKFKLGFINMLLAAVVLFILPFDSPVARSREQFKVLAGYKLDKLQTAGAQRGTETEDVWVRAAIPNLKQNITDNIDDPQKILKALEAAYRKAAGANDLSAADRAEVKKDLTDLYAGLKDYLAAKGAADPSESGEGSVFDRKPARVKPLRASGAPVLTEEFLSYVKRYPEYKDLLSKYFSVGM